MLNYYQRDIIVEYGIKVWISVIIKWLSRPIKSHAIHKSYEVLFKYYIQGDNFRFIVAKFVHVAFVAVGVPYFFFINQQFYSETQHSPLKRESITRYIKWTGVTFYTTQKGSFTNFRLPNSITGTKKIKGKRLYSNEENEGWIWTAEYSVVREMSVTRTVFNNFLLLQTWVKDGI